MVKACMASFVMPYPINPCNWHCPLLRAVDWLSLLQYLSHSPGIWKCWSRAPGISGWGGVPAQVAPSLAVPQALEVTIPANMTPLCVNVGPLRGFITGRLRGATKDLPPPICPYVCKDHLGVKLSCPSTDLPQLGCYQVAQKKQIHTLVSADQH